MRLLLVAAASLLGCSGKPIANPSNHTSAPSPRAAPGPARDLVGWATRTGGVLRLELADRNAMAAEGAGLDCKSGPPPLDHLVIEIGDGSSAGTYPAKRAQACPAQGTCTALASAVVTIETHIDETDGGLGSLELTFADGGIERGKIEYDYCYR